METTGILFQGAVVILAILLGVRTGGIGLGLWGLTGLAVLVFGFGLPPGEPPTTSMFIILSVITAASTMQAVGGIDYLVEVAKKLLKKRPEYIALVAPIVAFVFTLGAGTGFIYYPLIPVIYAVSYANIVRPERPLAVASTASQFAITASPVSAAMATMVGILDPVGFDITDILIVVLPASIVGLLWPASSRCGLARNWRTTRSTRGAWRRRNPAGRHVRARRTRTAGGGQAQHDDLLGGIANKTTRVEEEEEEWYCSRCRAKKIIVLRLASTGSSRSSSTDMSTGWISPSATRLWYSGSSSSSLPTRICRKQAHKQADDAGRQDHDQDVGDAEADRVQDAHHRGHRRADRTGRDGELGRRAGHGQWTLGSHHVGVGDRVDHWDQRVVDEAGPGAQGEDEGNEGATSAMYSGRFLRVSWRLRPGSRSHRRPASSTRR